MARPRRYSSAVADRICERLLEGRSLKSICEDRGMPAASTVFRWLAEDPAFSRRYAQARQAQADALFEEILEIADCDEGDTARARLKIDTRKWLAAKIAPRRYGDQAAPAGSAAAEMTPEQRRARIAELVAKAGAVSNGGGDIDGLA
jgi:hypothetical protein